jgi:catechol 2,3-dioxygenase
MVSQVPQLSLGHVHLKVRDLGISERFYRDVLGLRTVERIGDAMAFLSFGAAHHDLALQALGPAGTRPGPTHTGLYHTAFESQSASDLAGAWRRAAHAGAHPVGVDHGISWAVYFEDPDGHGVEVYLDRRQAPGGRGVWHARSRPLHLETVEGADGARPASTGVTP